MNVDENLNNVLNVLDDEPTNIEVVEAEPVDIELVDEDKNPINTISCKEDAKQDYEMGRQTIHQLISAGQEALEGVLDLAKQSDQPRAYEVFAITLKNLADATDKLLDMQKKARAMDGIKISKDGSTTQSGDVIHNNNTFFTGTTEELHALLDGKQRGEE